MRNPLPHPGEWYNKRDIACINNTLNNGYGRWFGLEKILEDLEINSMMKHQHVISMLVGIINIWLFFFIEIPILLFCTIFQYVFHPILCIKETIDTYKVFKQLKKDMEENDSRRTK